MDIDYRLNRISDQKRKYENKDAEENKRAKQVAPIYIATRSNVYRSLIGERNIPSPLWIRSFVNYNGFT